MDTAKLELAAQRYAEAEDAREAAATDLRAESAAAQAQGADEVQVAQATGIPVEELRDL
ncbi:hypothetical protein V2S66_00370 [Streptomyces sp. V4-01]|uniref:Uncharacterized protein n=1 Tax=Actinacidiphila polyblastidii TaxID=3110430 RepID=A0ABU7P3P4_9ACTN|nr:hypothetical protein [Streptomyces sp. V4-01]